MIENYFESYDFSSRAVSLSSQNLTAVCHPELFAMVVKIDLSNNKLASVKGFSCFQCAKEITLDGNRISDVEELSFLKDLTHLSIQNNCILSGRFGLFNVV